MSTTVAFVSVNKSFYPGITLSELEKSSFGFWGASLERVEDVDVLCAVYEGCAVASWKVRGAYKSRDYTYRKSNGSVAPRVAFSLGDPIVLASSCVPLDLNMRAGIDIFELDEDLIDDRGNERQ